MEKREFAADLDVLPEVLTFVESEAEASGVAPVRMPMLELLLEEIVANICLHAHPAGGKFAVAVTGGEGRIGLQIEDDGVPFDPLKMTAPDIEAEVDEREIGGLGLVLIRKIADSLSYRRENGCNILTASWPKLQDGGKNGDS